MGGWEVKHMARGSKVDIPVVPHKPWIQRNIPIPPGLYDKLFKLVKQKMNAGVFEPSNSSYWSRWFCVLKKDGKSLHIVQSLSVWMSSFKTGKRPRLDWTKTDQDQKFSRPIKTITVVRFSVYCQSQKLETGQRPVLVVSTGFFSLSTLALEHTFMDISRFFQHGKKKYNKHTPCYIRVTDTKIHYSIMPVTTWMIAKGVPPRVHKPKGKAKAKPQAKQANTTKPSHKRVASKLDSEEAEDEAELRVKKKQNTTHHWSEESESEVELVEDGANPPEEEVESVDETHSSEVPDEQEVGKCYLFERNAYQYLGRWP
jgi:hypothetical protein